jgi:hypothetical protein
MAITLLNLSAQTNVGHGVTSDETGINVSSFKISIEPEFKKPLNDKSDEVRGYAIGAVKKEVSIEGEQLLLTGVMAAVVGTAFVPTNTTSGTGYFGAPTTGLYLDKAEISMSRGEWKTVSASFTANAGVT